MKFFYVKGSIFFTKAPKHILSYTNSRKSVEVTIPNTNLSSIPCDRNGASVAKVRTSLFYLYFSYVMKTLDVISFRQGRRDRIYTCVPMYSHLAVTKPNRLNMSYFLSSSNLLSAIKNQKLYYLIRI